LRTFVMGLLANDGTDGGLGGAGDLLAAFLRR
jgi:hypothetical protein